MSTRVVNTIFNRYNEVATTLAENPTAYRPMFIHDAGSIIVDHWAVEFMRGIGLHVQASTDIPFTDVRLTLAPIFSACRRYALTWPRPG